MLAKLRIREVNVRKANSHLFTGEEKFTGVKTYSVTGYFGSKRFVFILASSLPGAVGDFAGFFSDHWLGTLVR
jgi:hypothetical protein